MRYVIAIALPFAAPTCCWVVWLLQGRPHVDDDCTGRWLGGTWVRDRD